MSAVSFIGAALFFIGGVSRIAAQPPSPAETPTRVPYAARALKAELPPLAHLFAARYWVEVDVDANRVYVYDRDDNLVREMVGSAGLPGMETPRGTFYVGGARAKVKYQWLPQYGVGARWWTRFYGAYLFHSVPVDKNGVTIQEELDKLGQPASHGCVRLIEADARWVYDNIGVGTRVVIR